MKASDSCGGRRSPVSRTPQVLARIRRPRTDPGGNFGRGFRRHRHGTLAGSRSTGHSLRAEEWPHARSLGAKAKASRALADCRCHGPGIPSWRSEKHRGSGLRHGFTKPIDFKALRRYLRRFGSSFRELATTYHWRRLQPVGARPSKDPTHRLKSVPPDPPIFS